MIKPKYTKLRIILVATIIFFSLAPMLIVGIGIPFLYKDIPCIVLAMFIAWQNICNTEYEVKSILRGESNARISNKGFASNSRF